jgi:hypothetical protein
MFREVARRLDTGINVHIGGSNVRDAVSKLLRRVADAAEIAPDPHADELWANELQRRQRQVPADREWS